MAFPVLVHKTVGNEDLHEMEDKKECPQRDSPGVPVIGLVNIEAFIDDVQKQPANNEQDKMPEYVLFLPDSVAGVFILFVLQVVHIGRFLRFKGMIFSEMAKISFANRNRENVSVRCIQITTRL
jgi:hypothetical protein